MEYLSLNINKETGEFIRRMRIRSSLTGMELGRLINVSQQQISRYETGKNNITLITLDKIFQVLNVTWEEFIISNKFIY